TDRASLIKGYAVNFETCLTNSTIG
ncbi:MAG: hypothetical protein QOD00_4052, partial [Blastocatellia bacterium]|nr:hypothetical protein [Blastocatellia bacterium]